MHTIQRKHEYYRINKNPDSEKNILQLVQTRKILMLSFIRFYIQKFCPCYFLYKCSEEESVRGMPIFKTILIALARLKYCGITKFNNATADFILRNQKKYSVCV